MRNLYVEVPAIKGYEPRAVFVNATCEARAWGSDLREWLIARQWFQHARFKRAET
jgi:hypothetical protein